MPTGCTYDSGLYECDYSTLSSNSLIPLEASRFSPIAQRLKLIGLPSALNSAVFHTDFASLDENNYDTNYPASLELECELGDSLDVASGFLANMGHLMDFKITNCALGNIPANAFSELGTLDKFMIENGTITSIDGDLLSGITIVRNTSASPAFPKHHGAFIIKNAKLDTSSTIPTNLFTGQTGLYEVVLRNMNLSSIDAALFGSGTCVNIRYLDLSDNSISDYPSSLFSNLKNLGVITMYGQDIACSCSSLWFMDHANTNYLTLDGDIICTSTGKLAWEYYHSNCVEEVVECDGGLALAGACLTPIDLTGFSLGFIAFVLGWVVLGLTIHTKKQMGQSKGKGGAGKKPGAKKPAAKKPTNGWA
ncbi:Toll-like receptor 7 [Mactra antiquata]